MYVPVNSGQSDHPVPILIDRLIVLLGAIAAQHLCQKNEINFTSLHCIVLTISFISDFFSELKEAKRSRKTASKAEGRGFDPHISL